MKKVSQTANEALENRRAKKDVINLHDTTDATIWTKEWLKTIEAHLEIPTDEGTMIGWFAIAIMAGYDAGRRAGEQIAIGSEPVHGANTERSKN